MFERRRSASPLTVAFWVPAGRFGAGLLTAFLTAATAAQVASAQAPGTTEQRLLETLDSLRVELVANPAAVRAVRGHQAALALDTFMVGGIRVITPAEDSARVERWVRDAVAAVERRTGALPLVTDPPTIRVDWRPIDVQYRMGDDWARVTGATAAAVRWTVESAVTGALTRALADPVRDWLTGPIGVAARPYQEMAAGRTWVIRDCVQGDADACEVALGLAPLDTAFLDAPTRRELEAALATDPPPQRLGDGRTAFLSPEARRDFLHHLIRTRPDALGRLLTVEGGRIGGPRAIMEDAAGGPLGPVVSDWVSTMAAEGPVMVPASVVGTTVLWILLLVGLATRSTRWRAA